MRTCVKQYPLPTDHGDLTLLHLDVPGPTALVRAVVGVGADDERRSQRGAAHFLEHMAFKGTEYADTSTLIQRLSRIGNPNAYTSRTRTVYTLDTTPDRIVDAAAALSAILFRSTLPVEEMEKERSVILQEWQSGEDDGVHHYFNHAAEKVRGEHPIIGDEGSIRAHTVDTLRSFAAENYAYDRIAFAIVGPCTARQREKVIRSVRAYAPRAGLPRVRGRRPAQSCGWFGGVGPAHLSHSSEQAVLGMWWPWFTDARVHELDHAPDVFTGALGGGMHSVLSRRLREQLGLCYACGVCDGVSSRYPTLVAYAMLDAKNVTKAERAILAAIQDIATNGLPTDVLETARAAFVTSNAYMLDSKQALAHRYIDSWFDTPAEIDRTRVDTLRSCQGYAAALTQERAREFARGMLAARHRTVIQRKRKASS
jgi:predicted Zn-dependent peptidase